MCKVSVIVPVYNGEKFLRNCLDSLAAQTMNDIEIIIINDGSTDGSLAIAKEYSAEHPFFRVYTTKNSGVSHARNYGAEMAHGEYYAFVDSDDIVEPDYCKAMYEKAINGGNDLVVCQFDRVTAYNGQLKRISSPNVLFQYDNFSMLDHKELLPCISVGPWNKLIRRELFAQSQFPEGVRYAEDQVFSIKAFCQAKSIGTVNRALYHYYYETHDGVTSSFGKERLDWLVVMDLLFGYMQTTGANAHFNSEIEYFIVAKSIRLWTSATIRKDLPLELRTKLVKEIQSALREKAPHWRKNSYYIEEVTKRSKRSTSRTINYYKGRRVKTPYYNYGARHLLILIYLSSILPGELSAPFYKIDQGLFFAGRWIRWNLLSSVTH